jgi:glycosyltransferase involved in cell wall biosynthesis
VIVDNINGFLVDKNKPEDFSNKMYEVLTNHHLRNKLIKNGSHRLQKYFTAKKMANRYLELMIND